MFRRLDFFERGRCHGRDFREHFGLSLDQNKVLGTTVLVVPPVESTLPVRVYTLIANTRSSEVAALTLMQALVILIPLAPLGTLASNRGKG